MTRLVAFDHATEVRFVPNLMDMSKEELVHSWYTEEEERAIQADLFQTLKVLRSGIEGAQNDVCTRGLEHLHSSLHLEKVKTRKKNVIKAVLREQARQKKSRNP
mmetsp:Transcript_37958/g.113397  ORF Transcript_37958/g.113397 Transcript_37958/m.113397 type:complete len:104 (-) Transcript_37958:552-863(-)